MVTRHWLTVTANHGTAATKTTATRARAHAQNSNILSITKTQAHIVTKTNHHIIVIIITWEKSRTLYFFPNTRLFLMFNIYFHHRFSLFFPSSTTTNNVLDRHLFSSSISAHFGRHFVCVTRACAYTYI